MRPTDTFQNRLETALKIKNIKPVELHEKTGISESLLSKYLSGSAVARQRKLTLLADALNLNEVWLMGYDVPMERNPSKFEIDNNYFEFKAEDDAMFPLLDIGDLALVYKQTTFDKDATYLIKLNNKKTIRRIIEGKECYELYPMNPCYKVDKFSKKDFLKLEILGKVIKTENYSAFK